jgi:hypothetical protein
MTGRKIPNKVLLHLPIQLTGEGLNPNSLLDRNISEFVKSAFNLWSW